ncbi:MAG: DUF1559 domain-containing protein [Planctomycetaceae bacterium]
MAVFRDRTGSLLSSFLITFGFGYLILSSGGSSNVRLSAQSSACKRKMSELGIALLNANHAGSFSPVTGSPPLSWRVQLLPHLDPQLGEGYDTTQAWDSQPNREVGMRMPLPYRCPAHFIRTTINGLATTDYALVTGPGTIFPAPDSVLDLKRITDGASNTILMAECSGLHIPWTEPRDIDVSREKMTINELGPDSGSPSVLSSYEVSPSREWSCVHVLLADGRVRSSFDPSKTDPEVIRKMLTANGGENIDDDDF